MDGSLQNALVSWVNTFCDGNILSSLTDDAVTSGLVLGVITEKIFGAGAEPCPEVGDERFEYVAAGLAEFYQLSADLLIDVCEIAGGSLSAIGKTLMLLLSWAVHCQQNETFIVDIRSLTPENQHCLMLLINTTMKQMGDGSLAAGHFRVGLDCYSDAVAQSPASQVVGATSPSSPELAGTGDTAMASPVLDAASTPGQPGSTPASSLQRSASSAATPHSHCAATLSRLDFEAKMNPSPVSKTKPRPTMSSRRQQRSVCFTPPSSQVPSTPVARSSCKQGGVWKKASPALRRWIASPACSTSASVSSTESAGDAFQRQMSSVTFALREQIGLREDLEMQLHTTQTELAKSETNARDVERQCRTLDAQLGELDDLRHADVELKKTQSKLERALKRLESAADLKNHAEEVQKELNAARTEVVAMETKMAESEELAGRIEFYKAQLHGSELRGSTERARVEQLQAEMGKLSALYSVSTKQAAAANADTARLQGQVELLQEELEKANCAGNDDGALSLAESSEIARLLQENEELRSQLPTKEEMRLMRSQLDDATTMKASFENLYVETKRQLLEVADERSAAEHRLTEVRQKVCVTQQLLEAEQSATASLQQQLKSSEESLASAVDESNRLSGALAESVNEVKASKTQTAELQQQLAVSRHELQASNETAANTKENLLAQLGDTRLELDSVQHVSQETAKKFTGLQSSTDAQQEKWQEQRKHWQQLLAAANEKSNDFSQEVQTLQASMAVEREQQHTAFVKLQAKYDEACLERRAAQQQLAAATAHATTSAQECLALQEQLNQQQAKHDDLELQNSQLETRLGEALEHAQSLQCDGSEQLTALQNKLREQEERHGGLFAAIGQSATELLQRVTGAEWKPLDADASISAHQHNTLTLLKQLDERFADASGKSDSLQGEVDDVKQQLASALQQAAEDLAASQQESAALVSEKAILGAADKEKEAAITLLSSEKIELAEQLETARQLAGRHHEQCTTLQSTIAELEVQNTTTTAELSTAKRSVENLGQRLASARQAAELEQAALAKLQAKYDETCVNQQDMEMTLAASNCLVKTGSQELQSVQDQLTALQAAHKDLVVQKSQLNAGLAAAVERAEMLETASGEQTASLHTKLSHQEQAHRQLFFDVAQLTTKLLQQVTGMEWKPLDVDASTAAHGQNILALLKQLDEQCRQAVSKHTAIQAGMTDLKQQLAEKQKQLAEELALSRKESDALLSERASVQTADKEKEAMIAQLSSDRVELAEQLETARQLAGRHNEQCTTLQSTIAELDVQRSTTAAELSAVRGVLSEQEILLEERTAELQKASHTFDEHSKEMAKLQDQLRAQQQNHDQQLSALHQSEDDLRSQLEEMKAKKVSKAILDDYATLQRKHAHVKIELERKQSELDTVIRRQAELTGAEEDAKKLAEQTSASLQQFQQEMHDNIQRHKEETEDAKVTCRAVMDEARKRGQEATVKNQELVDELSAMQEHIHAQDQHYKQLVSSLQSQLKQVTHRLHAHQHDTPSHRPSMLLAGDASCPGKMAQPGYESVHAEFDKGQQSTSQHLDKLSSPKPHLDEDISSFLAGKDRPSKRMSTRNSESLQQRATSSVSRPPFAWDGGEDGDHDCEDNDDLDEERLKELRRRNTLAPSHLKSTYPIELQVAERPVSGKSMRHSTSGSKSQAGTSASRTSSRVYNMETVSEERVVMPAATTAPQSFTLEISPPSRKSNPSRPTATKRPVQHHQDDDSDDDMQAAKRRQTFLIASPTPKESNVLRQRTMSGAAARSASNLTRNRKASPSAAKASRVTPASHQPAQEDVSVLEKHAQSTSKLPPRLAARMAQHQQKASEKAASSINAATTKKTGSKPLSHRNRA